MFDVVIIGYGVVGRAIALLLVEKGFYVLSVEKDTEANMLRKSRRSSGVIHAEGTYFNKKNNPMRASLCKPGRDRLVEYCKSHENIIPPIDYRICGQLVVATNEPEFQSLDHYQKLAADNGFNLEKLTASEAADKANGLVCHGALFARDTGVLKVAELLTALREDALRAGLTLMMDTLFIHAVLKDCFVSINLQSQEKVFTIQAKYIINAAGFFATHVAKKIVGLTQPIPVQEYWLGMNFKYRAFKKPFLGRDSAPCLVYPIPADGKVGVHSIIRIGEEYDEFGPIQFKIVIPSERHTVSSKDYELENAIVEEKTTLAIKSIQAYFPSLDPTLLSFSSETSGILSRVSGHDYQFVGERNTVHLYGIESPGLTSCFGIADHVLSNHVLPSFSAKLSPVELSLVSNSDSGTESEDEELSCCGFNFHAFFKSRGKSRTARGVNEMTPLITPIEVNQFTSSSR